MNNRLAVSILAATLGWAGVASATLIDRGNGMIYDSNRNLTWLQDTNYARTSGYDSDGLMSWGDAMAWAENLSYGGHDDWRLPRLDIWPGLSQGYFVISSEIYTVMAPELSVNDPGAVMFSYPWMSFFTNASSVPFWYGVDDGNTAWAGLGPSSLIPTVLHPKSDSLQAWAVREGDVAAIPEPQSFALVALGLACMGYSMRKPSRLQRGRD